MKCPLRLLILPVLLAVSPLLWSQEKPWMLGPFVKQDQVNPIMEPGALKFHDPILNKSVAWEEKYVFNPAAVVKDGKVYLLYRAEDTVQKYAGVSRIGLAQSSDGLHFERKPHPVLYPQHDAFKQYEWEGGCEDPRIVEDDQGTYYMTYTAYDGTTARLFIATSAIWSTGPNTALSSKKRIKENTPTTGLNQAP